MRNILLSNDYIRLENILSVCLANKAFTLIVTRYYTCSFVTKNCSREEALIFYLAVFILFLTNCVISDIFKICSKVTELQLDAAVCNSSLKILRGS